MEGRPEATDKLMEYEETDDYIGNYTNDEKEAIQTVRNNTRLIRRFYYSDRIRNYNKWVLTQLNDEHKQEYEKMEDKNDKFYFLLMRLLETIPKVLPETEKRAYERDLYSLIRALDKMLTRQFDYEAEIYEKDIEEFYCRSTSI